MGRDQARLNETLSQLSAGEDHIEISCDLTNMDQIAARVKEIVERVGKIDGFIHAAGISTTLPSGMISGQNLDQYFRTNVYSGILLAKEMARKRYISPSGASFIFIGSVMGILGAKGKTLYGMSKGALIAASKSLSLELAGKKIRVNCVSPGVVESPMSNNSIYSQDPEYQKRVEAMHPLGMGNPEDVANACIFLLSDESKWITGINLIVDGGYSAH